MSEKTRLFRTNGVLFSLLSVPVSIACSSGEKLEDPANESLAEGVAALVAGEAIGTQTVLRVAAAQRIELAPARERAISDALFSAFARERYAGTGRIESIERSALGRSMLEELWRVALSQGEPTDEEVAELTAERWFEFDRPVCVRTTHAVVRAAKPEQKHKARAVAERIAEAVRGVKEPLEFRKRALAVPRDGLEVVAEGLQPTSVEGRVHNQDPAQRGPAQYDPSFARAAHAIAEVGAQSPITETKFGFHVILLEQRFPEQRVPLAERRRVMRNEIVTRRAQRAERDLGDRLRRTNRVEIERAAEDLTANVRITP